MKAFVTGATGFTGRRVARRLVEAGHEVTCLVRPTSDRTSLADLPVAWVTGDLGDEVLLAEALRGMDALVNVASIGFGHGPGIVRSAERAGVRRAVFFSTTAIFTSLPAASRTERLKAEEAVRSSTLDWTILRPTMIYGAPGDRNVERLLRTLRRTRILPSVGSGDRRIQPVLVDDLAIAATAAITRQAAVRRTYSLPGRSAVPFSAFIRAAAHALGRRVALVPIPEIVAVAGARIYEAVVPRPRIRAEQILRLLEHKDFDWRAAARDLDYDPRGVEEGLRLEVERLGWGGGV